MKKLLFLSTLLLASTFIYVACEKDSYENLAIKDAQKMVEQFNIGKLEQEQGKYFEGAVQITAVEKDGIYVKVSLPNSEKTQNFHLQMANVENAKFREDMKKAEIIYLRNAVIINSLEKPLKIMFALIEASNVTVKIEAFKNLQYDGIYKGFGLANYDSPEVQSRYIYPECGCQSSSEQHTCSSGGQGSTSCSLTNGSGTCTVTCGTGYYSCCNW